MSITSKLKFVSTNSSKLKEFRFLLGIHNLELSKIESRDYQELNIETIVREKLSYAKEALGGVPFFVEHTGIEIDAWNQLPSGLTGMFMNTVGAIGICKMMQGFQDNEKYASAISWIGFSHNGKSKFFRGVDYGKIAKSPRNFSDHSWTWDSIFIPDAGNGETYSEMGFIRKNQISMRKKAADEFSLHLKKEYGFEYSPKIKVSKDLIEELKVKISNTELGQAILKLEKELINTNEHDEILILKARLKTLEKDQMSGILLDDQFNVRRNKIRKSFLELLEKIK